MRQAAAAGYVELGVMTNFSFLQGASHADELVATAKALGLAGSASPTGTLSPAWCARMWRPSSRVWP